ncbi:MAG: ATP-binding protein, partial [Nitrosomonadaceae bacterium]|nr:ATP-binding protein [Nitrosomonadaceae bacterium]
MKGKKVCFDNTRALLHRVNHDWKSEMTDKFIELHRTFRDLPKEANESDDTDFSQWLSTDKRLRWPNLTQERRLVILSEAGSGKTTEIRNIARSLRSEGKSAFFLRLEHVADDFEDSFEEGTYEEFVAWLTSSNEGWLFLDSVDEARLQDPRDFELAIHKLSKQISIAKDRVHIVITSRTTAWRPKTDLTYCETWLPYARLHTSASSLQTKNIESDDDIAPDSNIQTQQDSRGETSSIFRIVALDDLASDQIEIFVKARGIADSKAFLDAVERADAWLFTARPQDLEELIGF